MKVGLVPIRFKGFFLRPPALKTYGFAQKRKEKPRKEKPASFERNLPVLVGATGFEPATFWSRTKRATKLRYAPNEWSQRGDSNP